MLWPNWGLNVLKSQNCQLALYNSTLSKYFSDNAVVPEELYKAWLCMLLVKLIIHQQTNDHIAEPLFTGSLAWPGLLCLRNQGVSAYTCHSTISALSACCILSGCPWAGSLLVWQGTRVSLQIPNFVQGHIEKQHGMISERVRVEESKSPVAWFRVTEWTRPRVTPREVCNTDDSWRHLFSSSLYSRRLTCHGVRQ